MAQLMEYAEYLSKEIGPRPAGTEEEQQAALYITERFQKDSGFSAQIEEFTSSSNVEFLSGVPGLVVIVVAILGMIFPMLAIPAFILAAAAAALYALEAFGHPIVTRALARGASQNVVAKYQPGGEAEKSPRARTRKVVLVAHYDSGKVTPGLVRTVESTKLPVPIGLLCVCGIVLAAFFLLLHVFINTGVGGIVINVLTVIALILCLYPVLRAVLYRVAPYNEGANNNATGTAALIEIARRISRGSVSEADLAADETAQSVSIHGEDAARESGLVPEGAQIRYEAENLVPPAELGEYDEEERLLAAKAAIAAMTGQPVERRTYGSVATHLVNSRAQGDEPSFEPAAQIITSAPEDEAISSGQSDFEHVQTSDAEKAPVVQANEAIASAAFEPPVEAAQVDGFKNAPSWFVAAQQNAKKPEGEAGPVQRSRYAEAIEAAEREMAEREREREEAERAAREAELKAREQAAREAIEQSVQATVVAPEQPKTQEDESASADNGYEPAQTETPVFVPYEEAAKADEESTQADVPAQDAPAVDEFAASLGSTVAFDPRMLKEAEETPSASTQEGEEQPEDRLAGLPQVDGEQTTVPETTSPSRSGMIRKLRVDVPSMSGVIRMQQAGEDVSQIPVQQPAPAPTPAPAPVNVPAPAPAEATEAVDYDMNPAEIQGYAEVEADYSDSHDDFYEEGVFEDDNAVEMPKSRAGGFFGRFRRDKHDKLEETPQEWLDVDEDFDARTVGRERGGWESFRDDSQDDFEKENPQGRKWEGGSYSRVRLGRVDTRSGDDADVDMTSESIPLEEDRQIADEIEQIYHFRNPQFNTEVWFVALGSDNAAHDGVKAFIAEHGDELRGSMIIEVESLGLGELCVASAEGRIKKIAASSRIKRYSRTATAATGIAPGDVDLTGSDSAASIMQAAGYQVMHLLGVENGQPALKGSPDDILENVDDLLFDDNVNFVMELLKK